MAETKARFCDVCKKLVSIQGETWDGKDVEWRDKVLDYWQSKDKSTIVCIGCWEPLWAMIGEIGDKSLTELLTWLVNPDEEDNPSE